MKKTLLILITLFLCKEYSAYSQTILVDGNTESFENISQEKIFVHHNTSFLLTGEHLLYKVYCINTETNNLTNFSKIAYVELVKNDKTLLFKHKIVLKNGLGQGDFFIPTSVTSGNYKVIAYTQWMRNSEISNFYQNDISIINPFQANQNEILKVTDSIKSTDSIFNNEYYSKHSLYQAESINNFIDLKTNVKTFSARKKVSLTVNSLKGATSYGDYSISVRKIDTLQIPDRQTANAFSNLNSQKTILPSLTSKTILFLPELRGELYSGKIILKENKKPVNNIKVALSIPGKNYFFKIANTNREGVFYLNIDKEYNTKNATIQILHNEPEKFELTVNQQLPLNYDDLEFYTFKITPETEKLILNRSIQIQIENAYSNEKLDSIKSIQQLTPFLNNKAKSYILDEYTRFKTLKETFVEIIPEIYTRHKKGNYTFHVRVYNMEIKTGVSPLVIIDGNLIQNPNELAEYTAKNINKISVVNELYVYGGQLFEGIISIETFNGDYKQNISGDYVKKVKLFKPQINKKYFNQVYGDSSELNRIPDFRSQLLWKPDFNLNTEKATLTFYTSDNIGDYEICLEGFTKKGKPVSIRKIIRVE